MSRDCTDWRLKASQALAFMQMYSPSMFRRIPYMNSNGTSRKAPVQGKKNKNSGPKNPPKGSKQRLGGDQKGIAAPAALTRVNYGSRPNIQDVSRNDQSIRVRHREYIKEVPGSVGFSAVSLSINPGLSTCFPWLSSVARNYETYTFNSLSFEFETQKSSASNGSVMQCIDYDAADATPADKTALMANRTHARSAVWEFHSLRCDVPDLQKIQKRYVRAANLASNLDIKTYDVGNQIIATQGCADTSSIGELYVTYDITLQTPQLHISASCPADSPEVKYILGGSSLSESVLIGTSPTVTGSLSAFTLSTTTFTATEAGRYLFAGKVTATGTLGAVMDVSGTCSVVGSLQRTYNSSLDSTDVIGLFDFDVGETLIFSLPSGQGPVTATRWYICPWEAGVGSQFMKCKP